MKRNILICCFVLATSLLNAQKIYFVYLQTESAEPFFIRLDDKFYNSTSSGYLIVPRLKDSTYNMKLGFPGKNTDFDFSVFINKKDHGYLIKNLGEKGWGFFDLQTLSLQMSSGNKKIVEGAGNNPSDQVNAFTELLSKAADDPTLKENTILVKQEEKKPEPAVAIQKEEIKKPEAREAVQMEEKKAEAGTQPVLKPEDKNEEVVQSNQQKPQETTQQPVHQPEEKKNENLQTISQKPEVKTEPVLNAEEKQAGVVKNNQPGQDSVEKAETTKPGEAYKKSLITKISGISTTEGFESIFVDDNQNGNKDTVRILVPGENGPAVVKEDQKTDSTKDQLKFLDIISDSSQVARKPEPEMKKEESKIRWPFNKNKNSDNPSATGEEKKEENKKPGLLSRKRSAETDSTGSEKRKVVGNKWGLFSNKDKSGESGAKACQSVARDEDFLKLRRKMASRTNDDGMMEEARKYFKEKCFSTEQIKNLGTMFLSNAGKYNFFELAHRYVSDAENFSSLQSEFKDEYYVNRFKNLLGN